MTNFRWCLVEFESPTEAEEMKKVLTEKKAIANILIKTQQMNIKTHAKESNSTENARKKYINNLSKKTFASEFLDKYSNKLMVTQLPQEITKDDLKQLFPSSLDVFLQHNPVTKAIVSFSSAQEAREARMTVNPIYKDKKIRVIMLTLDSASKSKVADEKKDNVNFEKKSKGNSISKKSDTRYYNKTD